MKTKARCRRGASSDAMPSELILSSSLFGVKLVGRGVSDGTFISDLYIAWPRPYSVLIALISLAAEIGIRSKHRRTYWVKGVIFVSAIILRAALSMALQGKRISIGRALNWPRVGVRRASRRLLSVASAVTVRRIVDEAAYMRHRVIYSALAKGRYSWLYSSILCNYACDDCFAMLDIITSIMGIARTAWRLTFTYSWFGMLFLRRHDNYQYSSSSHKSNATENCWQLPHLKWNFSISSIKSSWRINH